MTIRAMLASVEPKTHAWVIMDGEGNQYLNEKRMQRKMNQRATSQAYTGGRIRGRRNLQGKEKRNTIKPNSEALLYQKLYVASKHNQFTRKHAKRTRYYINL